MSFRLEFPTRRPGRIWATLALFGVLTSNAGCGTESDRPAPQPQAGAATTAVSLLLAPPLPADADLATTLAHPDPFERVKRVAEILAESPPERLLDVTAAFEAAPLPWGDMEYALFASWWARFDPAAAMNYGYHGDVRVRHPRALREIIRIWAYKDPAAVVESGWLNSVSIEMAGLNPEMVDPFVIGWFESGRPGLDAWLLGLDGSTLATAMNTYMRMRVLRDGPAKALEWTMTAPVDPGTQRLLLATGLNIVARQEPKVAVEWLAIAEKKGVDTRSLTARIGRGWASHDPKAAMEWVTAQDVDPNERWRTIHDIAAIWLERDEKGLETWLEPSLGEEWADPIRKQWIFNHVKKNRYHVDWLDLMRRTSEFVNEEARRAEYLWVFQRWNAMDPEAAAEWLEANKELLGDKLQFAHQLYADDRKEIEAILAEDKAAAESASGGAAGEAASKSES